MTYKKNCVRMQKNKMQNYSIPLTAHPNSFTSNNLYYTFIKKSLIQALFIEITASLFFLS